MAKIDVGKGRLEHNTQSEFSSAHLTDTFGAGGFSSSSSRLTASSRWKTPKPTCSILAAEDSGPQRIDFQRKGGSAAAASLKKFAEMHSAINVVNQTNAVLRERLTGRSQPVSLTRENLMILEETLENNRPAEQLRRKREFIQKEMEKSRQNAGSAEAKAYLLGKISQREEKQQQQQQERQEAIKETRADSVLEDLRKARFRVVAHMAQKRLQSMSPDLANLEDGGLSNRLDWYLRFCGEKEKHDEEGDELEEESDEEECPTNIPDGILTPETDN